MAVRGIWQSGKLALTRDEAAAAIEELGLRNIFHSERTLEEKERREVEQRLAEEEAAKRKKTSLVMWGAMGLGLVVTIIIAVR